MDNRSGFGEENDNNTGEIEERERENLCCCQCAVRRKVKHDAWMNDLFLRTKLKLEPCTHVICAV